MGIAARTKIATACLFAAACLVLSGCIPATPEQARTIERINAERAAARLSILALDARLNARADLTAARLRDAWVAAGCPNDAGGRGVGDFLTHTPSLAGHYQLNENVPNWSWAGENIGVSGTGTAGEGVPTAELLYREYMKSKYHRDNLMKPGARLAGLGFTYGPTAAQSAAGACPNTPVNYTMWSAQVIVK